MTQKIENLIKKIKPEKIYSLRQISMNGLFGDGKTYFVCKGIITDDMFKSKSKKILKAEKTGSFEDHNINYYVKGENIIKYLTKNN